MISSFVAASSARVSGHLWPVSEEEPAGRHIKVHRKVAEMIRVASMLSCAGRASLLVKKEMAPGFAWGESTAGVISLSNMKLGQSSGYAKA